MKTILKEMFFTLKWREAFYFIFMVIVDGVSSFFAPFFFATVATLSQTFGTLLLIFLTTIFRHVD